MKKTYIQPLATLKRMEAVCFICGSKGVTSINGIKYGGVDTDGSMNPAARGIDLWDEDEDEDDW